MTKEIQTKIVESSFKERLLPKIGKPGDKPNDLNKSVPSFRQMNEIKEIGGIHHSLLKLTSLYELVKNLTCI